MEHTSGFKEGEATAKIYTLIAEEKYKDAIVILEESLRDLNNCRPGISLLAYCYYCIQDYENSANCYEELTILQPDVVEYKLYYAQSLHKACLYEEAMKVTYQIEDTAFENRVKKLRASIKYGLENYTETKSLVAQCVDEESDTAVNYGCLLYQEGKYEEACQKFISALEQEGFEAHLSYNIALCYYRMKDYSSSLKYIGDIIEKGIRGHPELGVGTTTEGIEITRVGNTLTLHQSALVEAFNLKAAVEYRLENYSGAQEAMTDMPPRAQEDLDSVTLHNQALFNMDSKPREGFNKLQFILQHHPFPPETFGNLLLLYCKYEHCSFAADVMAEYAFLTKKLLSPDLYEYIEAYLTQEVSPAEAFHKFDKISAKYIDKMRKLTKTIQEIQEKSNSEKLKLAINEYEQVLESYIPVVMAQAKIFWDIEKYSEVEVIFRKSVEFCNETDVWNLNVAHVLFMQGNKFKETAGFYEPIIKKKFENLLDVSAIVLGNLCVSYIMTSQNNAAEDLMRKIEKEEEKLAYEEPNRKIYHLCIVNLIIGTLYCSKDNYEFGISRVMKSMEPFKHKLGTDTWYYVKRCLLSFIEHLCKHTIIIKDSVIDDCLQFLDNCEAHGHDIQTVIQQPFEEILVPPGMNTVTYEARFLKAFLLKIKRM